jgi:hypothetical protein
VEPLRDEAQWDILKTQRAEIKTLLSEGIKVVLCRPLSSSKTQVVIRPSLILESLSGFLLQDVSSSCYMHARCCDTI